MAEVVRHPSSNSEREPFVDAQAVAEYLGVPVSTVRTWASRRKIPSHRINGRVIYRLSEVERCIESRESA